MIEYFLLILIAFSLPIPIWLIIFHIIALKYSNKLKKITYFSLGILWIISAVGVYKFREIILSTKFNTNLYLQALGFVFLIIAIIIDIKVVKILGYLKLTCVAELRNQKKGVLITEGIYKYARHPRYVEYLIIDLAIALLSGYYFFLYYAGYIFIGFYVASLIEEKELIKRFGKEYLDYMNKVPRFFII